MPAKRLGPRALRLPQELIDAIVDELRDDSSCLAACSKTAKTFRVPCHRWIFREMVIHTDESGYHNTYRRAAELLKSSPDIEIYVHNITAPWPTEGKDMRAFASFLRGLRSVQRLTISNKASVSLGPISTSGLNSALSNIISLASLNRLDLMNIADIPSSLIYHAVSSVRTLALDISMDHNNLTRLSPLQPQLEHLILSSRCTFYLGHFISSLQRDGYFQNLQRLTLSLQGKEDGYHELFNSLPATLRRLEIHSFFSTVISISKVAGLQFLELGFNIGFARSLPPNLDDIVSKLPKFAPLLETLVFTVRIIPRIPEISWAEHDAWPLFDIGFLERRELPRLQNVTCCLQLTMNYSHDSGISYSGFVTVMEKKLRGLLGTDMIHFVRGNFSASLQEHVL
ncbi:hypothetical protein MSAN_01060200 [Mycena sanguinolenta]|uniref:F-box domain-containing protein n=1 Tax=Mycena sanguinolenta TaxID=230812 RepID=A0A8H7D7A2_9AGAR|nr:hypothetical protein MSAN_01060200 [Mycena sanguinolenta]